MQCSEIGNESTRSSSHMSMSSACYSSTNMRGKCHNNLLFEGCLSSGPTTCLPLSLIPLNNPFSSTHFADLLNHGPATYSTRTKSKSIKRLTTLLFRGSSSVLREGSTLG